MTTTVSTARRGLVVFLALAFGLSWTAQIVVSLWARSLAAGGTAAGAFGAGIFLVAVALMWPPATVAGPQVAEPGPAIDEAGGKGQSSAASGQWLTSRESPFRARRAADHERTPTSASASRPPRPRARC